MKYKKNLLKLTARLKAWDAMSSKDKAAHKRPGSQKK